LLTLWNSNFFTNWISLAKTIEQEFEQSDFTKINLDNVCENMSKLLAEIAENISQNDNKSFQQFLYNSLIPLLLENQPKSLKEAKSNNDIKILKIDPIEEAVLVESDFDCTLLDDFIRIYKNIQEKLRNAFENFPNQTSKASQYRDLTIFYLAFPFEQVFYFVIA